jgi:hypothetical protein
MGLVTVLTTMLLLSSLANSQTHSSRVADALGRGYIGGNKIAGKHPQILPTVAGNVGRSNRHLSQSRSGQ